MNAYIYLRFQGMGRPFSMSWLDIARPLLGHINAASNVADWQQGHVLLLDLIAQLAPVTPSR